MERHFSIAWVMGALAVACSSETVARPPPPPVNWQSLQVRQGVDAGGKIEATGRERAVADAYIKALASSGLAQLGLTLDEDAHFAFAGAKDTHGREQVVKAHDALFGAFDQRIFTTSRVWRTDSSHALEWTMTGAQARDWRGVTATRKPVTIKGLTLLWTKDDGSISDVHVYFDEAVVKAQLGAGPKALLGLPQGPGTTGVRQEFEQSGAAEEGINVAHVRDALDALERNDESAYVGTMTDDVAVSVLSRAQPSHGKAEARAYFKAMRRAIGQLDPSIDNVWGIGQFVVVEYSIVGEQLGPIGWIPVQRDSVLKMSEVDVVEIQGGKIANVWRYDNPSQILSLP